MRSLSKLQIVFKLLGVRLQMGSWYKIDIKNDDGYFWVAKYYRIENNCFIHLDNSYYVNPLNMVSIYSSSNGIWHPLCRVVEIESIRLVNEDYVLSLGIEI
jgi:hypothetical protein